MFSTKTRILTAAVVLSAFCVAASNAAIISDTIFQIDAQNGDNIASFDVPLTSGNIDGDTLTWNLTEAIDLMDQSGNVIGTLESANVVYVADPVVSLNFVVSSAGGGNFTITSANLSFAGLSNAIGRASSAITVTDFDGNGASLTGNFPGNDTYRAFYNDPGMVAATGTTFATLSPGVVASSFASATSTEGFPDNAGTFTTMDESGGTLGTVSSMSAQWQFSASSGDSVSGTSTFVILPEPSSITILLLGVCMLIRRR